MAFRTLIYVDQGATPNNPSTTHVLLGNGKAQFTQSATVATVGSSLAIGNLAGNGHIDIGWVTSNPFNPNSAYSITVAAGTGTGAFNAPQSVAVPVTSLPGVQTPVWNYLLAAQVQTSGAMDLLAEDTANKTLWDFSFTVGPTHDNSSFPLTFNGVGPMTVADVNGDGLGDLIIDSQSSFTAAVYLNRNGHYIGAYASLTAGVHSLLIKDVNGDGRPDLIAEGVNGRMEIFPSNGDGTFQTTSIGGSGALDGTTGNGGYLLNIANRMTDGDLYVVAATPIGISVLLQSSTPIWGLDGIYNAGPGHSAYAMADFTGDGNLDLAVDSPEGIAILYGNPDGSFQTSSAYAAGQPAMSGALGVFTPSGHSDAVVSTAAKQAQFLRGNGDGSFTYAGAPGMPVPTSSQTGIAALWSAIQVGDVDSDGIQDLVLTADGPSSLLPTTPDGTVIQTGNGDGTFSAPVALPAASLLRPSCANGPGPLYGTSAVYPFRENAVGGGFTAPVWFINVLSADSARRFSGSDLVGAKSFPHLAEIGATGLAPTCQGNAHNLVITGTFTNSPYFSDAFVQQQGHLQLSFASEFGSPFLGDLAIDGSLTTPGQLAAPALSFNFNGPAIPTSAGSLGFPAFIGAGASSDLDRDDNTDLLVTYANLSANLQAPTAAAPNYLYIWFGSGNGKFLFPLPRIRSTPSASSSRATTTRSPSRT